jgi:hypothetical protein
LSYGVTVDLSRVLITLVSVAANVIDFKVIGLPVAGSSIKREIDADVVPEPEAEREIAVSCIVEVGNQNPESPISSSPTKLKGGITAGRGFLLLEVIVLDISVVRYLDSAI